METLADIKRHTALTDRLEGKYLKTKWQVVPGKIEKSGKYFIEILEAAFRFNDNCDVVSAWKDRAALADYERKCEANRKLISENLPEPQQEFESTIASRSESCLLSFAFDLDRVHRLVAEAKTRFQRGEIANKCTVSLCDFPTSGYQPLLKLEFTNLSSNPSIDLKRWEPKLGPRL